MEKKVYSSPKLEIVKIEMEESLMIPFSLPYEPGKLYE